MTNSRKIATLKVLAVVLALIAITAGVIFTVGIINKNNDSQTIAFESESNDLNMAEAEVSETQTADNSIGSKALAAALAVGVAAAGGAIGMGLAIAKSSESIARQPEVKGDVRATLMLGLVFIETVVIYSLIVAILVIFVL